MLRGKKKSVIVGWLCSYLIILLIPIISVFINYYYNVKVIKKEIIRVNEQIIDNFKNSIDELLEDQKAFFSYIHTNDTFFRLMSDQRNVAQFYYDASHFRSSLEDYCVYNEGLSCILYFVDKDYVINTSGANKSEYFYQSIRFYNPDMQDYDVWRELMTAEYNNEFLVAPFMHHQTTEECVVYADSLKYYDDNRINIFISVPVKEIIDRTESVQGDSQFLITIEKKDVLAISDNKIVEPVAEFSEAGVSEAFFELEEHLGLRRDAKEKGISYCLLISKKEFWKEARHVRNVLGISISITMLIGFVLVFLLIRRNFRPLSGLLNKMGGWEQDGNEFIQIEERYDELITKNQFMHDRILDQEKIVKKNALLRLMKGRAVELIEQEKNFFSLGEDEEIGLVGIEIPFSDVQLIRHDELLHFMVDNIFSELMKEERFYQMDDGQYLFYLFIIPRSKERWKRECMEKLDFLCDFIEEKCGVVLVAAVSKLEQELQKVRFQYQDVMEAFEFKSTIGGNGVIDTEIFNFDSDAVSIRSSAGELIEMALAKGNLCKLMEVVNQFFEHSKRVPLQIFRMQVMDIFQIAARNFFDVEEEEDRRMYLLGYLKPLLNASDRAETQKTLEEVLNYVYGTMHGQEQVGNKGIVAYIREYVETHYTDSILNISTIANSMGKNPKYIARVFKNETQEGILDYINDIRINKAVVLLSTGKYSVEEISEKVGYATVKTFRRTFLKMKGVTPGKFEAQDISR